MAAPYGAPAAGQYGAPVPGGYGGPGPAYGGQQYAQGGAGGGYGARPAGVS